MSGQIFKLLVTLFESFNSEYNSCVSILKRLNHELDCEIHQRIVEYSFVYNTAKELREAYQVLFLFE